MAILGMHLPEYGFSEALNSGWNPKDEKKKKAYESAINRSIAQQYSGSLEPQVLGASTSSLTDQAPVFSQTDNSLSQGQQTVTSPTTKPTGNSVRPAGNSVRGTNSVKAGKKQIVPSNLELQRKRALEAYRKSMNSSISSIDTLISMLDPTYAKTEQDYRTSMDKNRNDDLNALMAQAMSRGIGDSEFAVQAQERARTNYDNELSKFLSDLYASKQKEMAGYQSKKQQIQSQGYKDQADYESSFAKLVQDAQQQQFDNDIKLRELAIKGTGGGTKNDSLTKVGVSSNGSPIWYNNATHSYVNDLPAGTKDSMSEMERLLLGLQQNQPVTSGNNQNQVQANNPMGIPTGKFYNGSPVYQDENGNEFIIE